MVLCLDMNIADDDKRTLVETLEELTAYWSDEMAVALITFGAIVKIFDFSDPAASVAACFPGKRPLSAGEIASLQDHDVWFVRMDRTGKRQFLNAVSLAIDGTRRGSGGNEHRCTTVALEAAITITRKRSSSSSSSSAATQTSNSTVHNEIGFSSGGGTYSRCLVISNGPPQELVNPLMTRKKEHQPSLERVTEARNRFNELAQLASSIRLGIDFVGFGHRSLYVHLLQALTRPTNGLVMSLKKPTKPALLNLLCKSVERPAGLTASLAVTCSSSSIALRHLIGPVFPYDSSESDGQQQERSSSATVRHQWRMSNDPSHSVLLLFDVGDLADDGRSAVLFQFVARWSTTTGTLYRVFTIAQPVLSSPQLFYQSIHPAALAVSIGKMFTLEARKLAEHATAFATSSLIFERFDKHCERLLGTLLQLCRGADRAILEQIARQLYLLRHSVLLSDILQHPDDIDIVRALYLNASFEISFRLQSPSLVVFRGADLTPTAVAPDTLAMQSDCVLLFDQHYDIFVWVGAKAKDSPAEERAWAHAFFLSNRRYPYPQLMKFDEGSSMARWLSSRLAPSHLDPWAEACKSLPQLHALDDAARQQLFAKFHKTDDLSYFQWLQQVLPSESA